MSRRERDGRVRPGRVRGDEIVVIRWRDIPAQVNGRRGDERHQVVLPRRFQRSIDEAAMHAGKKTANEYIAEWRRESRALDPGVDLRAAVDAIAAEFEAALSREALQRFVAADGWDPDRSGEPTDG